MTEIITDLDIQLYDKEIRDRYKDRARRRKISQEKARRKQRMKYFATGLKQISLVVPIKDIDKFKAAAKAARDANKIAKPIERAKPPETYEEKVEAAERLGMTIDEYLQTEIEVAESFAEAGEY